MFSISLLSSVFLFKRGEERYVSLELGLVFHDIICSDLYLMYCRCVYASRHVEM